MIEVIDIRNGKPVHIESGKIIQIIVACQCKKIKTDMFAHLVGISMAIIGMMIMRWVMLK